MVKHCETAERAHAAWGGCGDDATTRGQNRNAGGRRWRGVARAELTRRPTSKKAYARDEGAAAGSQ